MFPQLLQFSPVDNKVKELIRPIALSELLAPLHIETRVELHNPDVLVVIRTTAWPSCARHHVASVHGIGADLFKENYSSNGSERMSLPWLPGPVLQCRWSGRISDFPQGRRSRPWRCLLHWWRDTRPRSRQCTRLPQGCRHLGEFLGCPRFHCDLNKSEPRRKVIKLFKGIFNGNKLSPSFVSQTVSPVSRSSAHRVACIAPIMPWIVTSAVFKTLGLLKSTLPIPPPTMILLPICKTAWPQLLWFPLCTDQTLEKTI